MAYVDMLRASYDVALAEYNFAMSAYDAAVASHGNDSPKIKKETRRYERALVALDKAESAWRASR